jgi:small ligand-binding sensory domain FIST
MPIRSATRFTKEPYNENRVQEIARDLRQQLGDSITLALAFCGSSYIQAGEDFFETLRIEGHIITLAGCSAQGLVHEEDEYQNKDGLCLIAFSMPEVQVHAITYTQEKIESSFTPLTWNEIIPQSCKAPRFALSLINPFAMDVERWFQQWSESHPTLPMTGGLASSNTKNSEATVFLNQEIIDGGLTLLFEGPIRLETIVSQGCRPIGEPMTITQANENILYSLGTSSAYEILNHAFEALPDKIKKHARNNLFVGLAMDEYREEFRQGDFLIRNILAADPQSGAVAVGARLRIGQTLQYQIRDATAASEELARLLLQKSQALKKTPPAAMLLFTCNGRGIHLFGTPGHDSLLTKEFFQDIPLAGFFCNGEIGPVHGRNYLHGYTASLALILDDPAPAIL